MAAGEMSDCGDADESLSSLIAGRIDAGRVVGSVSADAVAVLAGKRRFATGAAWGESGLESTGYRQVIAPRCAQGEMLKKARRATDQGKPTKRTQFGPDKGWRTTRPTVSGKRTLFRGQSKRIKVKNARGRV
jgi:hypothetical protein